MCRATLKIFEKKLLIVLEYFLDDLTPTCNISLFIKRCHVPSENIHVQEELEEMRDRDKMLEIVHVRIRDISFS